MPISVKKDVKPLFQLEGEFSLGDTPLWAEFNEPPIRFRQVRGSYLNAIRLRVAEDKWNEFYRSLPVNPLDIPRAGARNVAAKFDLPESLKSAFDELWTFVARAQGYEKDQAKDLESDLETAYHHAAKLAHGKQVDKLTFSRVVARKDQNFVIFSDFHITNFSKTLPNYFLDYNLDVLYLQVLDYYLDDYCLVENGDVEDCLMYLPSLEDAKARVQAAPKQAIPFTNPPIEELAFPILETKVWDEFLALRYAAREESQSRVLDSARLRPYYDRIHAFASKGRFVRLTGNHDTYIPNSHESRLLKNINDALTPPGGEPVTVHDALQILDPATGKVKYLVIHGHQFDEVCMQHGKTPWAKSLGEVITECLGWANQGGERFWTTTDTKRWYNGTSYPNWLAVSEPAKYQDGKLAGMAELVTNSINAIEQDSRALVEAMLGRQVGWEYFENTTGSNADGGRADGLCAFALETWYGEEMYKLKHLNEIKLCSGYLNAFNESNPSGDAIPTLIIGHTHEPRHNAVYMDSGKPGIVARRFYMNSGSAGRYENLIWCVEIDERGARIVSWSNIEGWLTRIEWAPSCDELIHASVTRVKYVGEAD